MLRVGVVGATDSARVHRARYDELEGVSVAGVAPAPGGPAPPGGDAHAYEDVEELLADAVDAIDVCAPAGATRPAVESAAAAGLPVACRAPLADDIADATAVADAVEDAGVPFVGGGPTRFGPEYAAVEEGVGEITGAPGVVRVEREYPVREGAADWRADAGETGSLLLDLAGLDVGFLRWAIGDIERVFARESAAGDSEHALTLLRFGNGAMAHLDTLRAPLPEAPYRVTVDLAGREGNVEFDSGDAAAMRFHDAGGSEPDPYQELPLTDGHGRDAYHYRLAHFRDVAAGDTASRASVADALRTTRATLAAVESARRGAPVAPAEVGR
ncbi:MAG: Gfo/Idh/MocA family protein [Halobacteriaceae archaeon]